MLEPLGETIRTARDQRGESLQTAAQAANISAAYLQKLERGTVGAPSPHVLRRLATALDLRYLELLSLAGYLSDAEQQSASGDERLRPADHPLRGQSLEPCEWRAVGAFIEYLKAQRQSIGCPGT